MRNNRSPKAQRLPGSRLRAPFAAAAAALSLLAGAALVAAAGFNGPAPVHAAPQAQETPSPEATASPAAIPSSGPVEPTYPPSPQESPSAPPVPAPVELAPAAITVQLGHSASAHLDSPPSGLVQLGGFDPAIVHPVFNPIERSIDVVGLRVGSTTITVTGEAGLSAKLAVTVQMVAGKIYSGTTATITGDPASSEFVAAQAAHAALLVSYAESGARVSADPASVHDAHELSADNTALVHVPVSITGPNYLPAHQTVAVSVVNIAQPRVKPKFVLVSDFPETLTENGTLFYADVNFDAPARLLYYHYEPPHSITRRVIVKVQNNGTDASLLQVVAGLAGPNSNVLQVGHESTRRFLKQEAANEGQIFEVPPGATINLIDQLLPADTLVSGLMQLRVISGDGVRVALVAQDEKDSPVDPISETLLHSAVRHARGVYQVPDFLYDEYYTVGDPPTVLTIGKLPLPNMAQGEVLGGDYGVKQSANVTLLNPTSRTVNVGMWFEPRGGRATGTFLIDGQLLQLHGVNPAKPELVRIFSVPPKGYRALTMVTMPEGGSSYPVNVSFSSQPPSAGSWSITPAVY